MVPCVAPWASVIRTSRTTPAGPGSESVPVQLPAKAAETVAAGGAGALRVDDTGLVEPADGLPEPADPAVAGLGGELPPASRARTKTTAAITTTAMPTGTTGTRRRAGRAARRPGPWRGAGRRPAWAGPVPPSGRPAGARPAGRACWAGFRPAVPRRTASVIWAARRDP